MKTLFSRVRPWLVLLAVAAAALSTAASRADETLPLAADHQDPARVRLTILLSHYEQSPTLDQLLALGLPDLQGSLVEVAANKAFPNIARGRAITHLQHFPLAGSRAYIDLTLAAYADEDPYIIGHLVRLVGVDLGAQDPQWAMTTLDPFVRHPDVGIREWAVVSLGAMRVIPGAQAWADEHLVQLLLAERSPGVRQALNRVLDGVEVLAPAGRPPIVRTPRATTAP